MNSTNMDEVQPVAVINDFQCQNQPIVGNVFSNDTEISSCVLRTIAYVDAHHDFKGKGIYKGRGDVLVADINKELGITGEMPDWIRTRYAGSKVEDRALQDWIPGEDGDGTHDSVIDQMTLSESDYTKSSNDLDRVAKYSSGELFTETNLLANGYTGYSIPDEAISGERKTRSFIIDRLNSLLGTGEVNIIVDTLTSRGLKLALQNYSAARTGTVKFNYVYCSANAVDPGSSSTLGDSPENINIMLNRASTTITTLGNQNGNPVRFVVEDPTSNGTVHFYPAADTAANSVMYSEPGKLFNSSFDIYLKMVPGTLSVKDSIIRRVKTFFGQARLDERLHQLSYSTAYIILKKGNVTRISNSALAAVGTGATEAVINMSLYKTLVRAYKKIRAAIFNNTDTNEVIGNEFEYSDYITAKRFGDNSQALQCLQPLKLIKQYDAQGIPQYVENAVSCFASQDRPAILAAIAYKVPIVYFNRLAKNDILFIQSDLITDYQRIKSMFEKFPEAMVTDFEIPDVNLNWNVTITNFITNLTFDEPGDPPHSIDETYRDFMFVVSALLPIFTVLNISETSESLRLEANAVENTWTSVTTDEKSLMEHWIQDHVTTAADDSKWDTYGKMKKYMDMKSALDAKIQAVGKAVIMRQDIVEAINEAIHSLSIGRLIKGAPAESIKHSFFGFLGRQRSSRRPQGAPTDAGGYASPLEQYYLTNTFQSVVVPLLNSTVSDPGMKSAQLSCREFLDKIIVKLGVLQVNDTTQFIESAKAAFDNIVTLVPSAAALTPVATAPVELDEPAEAPVEHGFGILEGALNGQILLDKAAFELIHFSQIEPDADADADADAAAADTAADTAAAADAADTLINFARAFGVPSTEAGDEVPSAETTTGIDISGLDTITPQFDFADSGPKDADRWNKIINAVESMLLSDHTSNLYHAAGFDFLTNQLSINQMVSTPQDGGGGRVKRRRGDNDSVSKEENEEKDKSWAGDATQQLTHLKELLKGNVLQYVSSWDFHAVIREFVYRVTHNGEESGNMVPNEIWMRLITTGTEPGLPTFNANGFKNTSIYWSILFSPLIRYAYIESLPLVSVQAQEPVPIAEPVPNGASFNIGKGPPTKPLRIQDLQKKRENQQTRRKQKFKAPKDHSTNTWSRGSAARKIKFGNLGVTDMDVHGGYKKRIKKRKSKRKKLKVRESKHVDVVIKENELVSKEVNAPPLKNVAKNATQENNLV